MPDLTSALLAQAGVLDQIAVAVCVAIILIAVYAYRRYCQFLGSIEQALARCERALAEAAHGHTPAEFAMDEALGESAPLRSIWSRFRQSLASEHPSTTGREVHLVSLAAPAVDFDPDDILHASGVNTDFYIGVPNLLVGLGLLFTFVGLTIALWAGTSVISVAITQDGSNASTQTLVPTLKLVLAATSFKFVTSLFGLLVSIVYSVAEKRRTHRYRLAVGSFIGALEAAFPIRRVDTSVFLQRAQIAALPLKIADAIGTVLDGQLRGIHATIASSIANVELRLRNAMQEALRETLLQLQTQFLAILEPELDAARSAIRAMGVEIRSTADELSAAIRDGAASLGSATHQAVLELQAGSRGVQEALTNGGAHAQSALVDAAQQVRDALNQSSQTFRSNLDDGLEHFGATFREAGHVTSEAADASRVLLRDVQRLSELGTESHERLTLAMSAFSDAIVAFTQTTESFSGTARCLESAASTHHQATVEMNTAISSVLRQLSDASKLIDGLHVGIAGYVTSAKDLLQTYTRTTDSQAENFEKLDAALSEVFGKLGPGLHSYGDQLSQFLSQLEGGVLALTSEIRDTAGELRDMAQDAHYLLPQK